jgi:hypothetical protein
VTGDGERLDEVSATLRRATEQRVGKRDLRQRLVQRVDLTTWVRWNCHRSTM